VYLAVACIAIYKCQASQLGAGWRPIALHSAL